MIPRDKLSCTSAIKITVTEDSSKLLTTGASTVVQGLRLKPSNAGGVGMIPGQGAEILGYALQPKTET